MRAYVVLSVLLLAIILGPFFLFEDSIKLWVEEVVSPNSPKNVTVAIIIIVLALDVFLPVPSSIVSTAAGALLGFTSGVAVSTAGMTIGCSLAYLCGKKWGLPLVRSMVGERDLADVSARFRKDAGWALASMRPVPVLAEASTLIAGMAGVPFPRFLSITTLANAGISTVYCAVGATGLATNSFLLAVIGSIALPGCLMLISGVMNRRR